MKRPYAATLLSIAASYYNDIRIQLDDETAMAHTLQRYDVDPREVRREACHEGRLPDENEIPGTSAW